MIDLSRIHMLHMSHADSASFILGWLVGWLDSLRLQACRSVNMDTDVSWGYSEGSRMFVMLCAILEYTVSRVRGSVFYCFVLHWSFFLFHRSISFSYFVFLTMIIGTNVSAPTSKSKLMPLFYKCATSGFPGGCQRFWTTSLYIAVTGDWVEFADKFADGQNPKWKWGHWTHFKLIKALVTVFWVHLRWTFCKSSLQTELRLPLQCILSKHCLKYNLIHHCHIATV